MRTFKLPLAGLAAALSLGLVAPHALAQDEDEDDAVDGEPLVFAQRDIVLEAGFIRPEGLLGFSKIAGVDDLYIQVFGRADWAPIENLQVGALAVPLTLSPESEYGNPRLYARYRLLDGAFQLAPELGFTFSIDDASPGNILDLGAPMRFVLNKAAYLELRPTLAIDFGDKTELGLHVPFEVGISFTRNIYFVAHTALNVPDFDFDKASVPLGVELGYSLANGDNAWIDLYLDFTLPRFLTPNDDEAIHADSFMIGLGGRFHFGLE